MELKAVNVQGIDTAVLPYNGLKDISLSLCEITAWEWLPASVVKLYLHHVITNEASLIFRTPYAQLELVETRVPNMPLEWGANRRLKTVLADQVLNVKETLDMVCGQADLRQLHWTQKKVTPYLFARLKKANVYSIQVRSKALTDAFRFGDVYSFITSNRSVFKIEVMGILQGDTDSQRDTDDITWTRIDNTMVMSRQQVEEPLLQPGRCY